jgi:hypothetical protein
MVSSESSVMLLSASCPGKQLWPSSSAKFAKARRSALALGDPTLVFCTFPIKDQLIDGPPHREGRSLQARR